MIAAITDLLAAAARGVGVEHPTASPESAGVQAKLLVHRVLLAAGTPRNRLRLLLYPENVERALDAMAAAIDEARSAAARGDVSAELLAIRAAGVAGDALIDELEAGDGVAS